jgi:hypothetical protein
MTSPTERDSFSDLFGAALAQFAKLFQNEVDLARAELSEKAGAIGEAVKFMAAGAVIVIPALTLILLAIARGLVGLGLSDPIAYLAVGVVAAAVAFLLIGFGARRLSPDSLKPSVTLEQIGRDKDAAEELLR